MKMNKDNIFYVTFNVLCLTNYDNDKILNLFTILVKFHLMIKFSYTK